MRRRDILTTVGGSLEAMGAGLSLLEPEWRWIGHALMIVGAIPLLLLAASYLPESVVPFPKLRKWLKGKSVSEDDTRRGGTVYNVTSHGSSGITAGSIGSVHVGKMPFAMTPKIMAEIEHHFRSTGVTSIEVRTKGPESSKFCAAALIEHLKARGISAVHTEHIGIDFADPMEVPLLVGPNWVKIDAGK